MAITKVTTGTIASETIKSANIEDGAIVNADVNSSAAIVASKLSGVESGLTSVQTFTSSATWTKPSGITKVMVEVQGAGGAGTKSATNGNRNGGGGGGYARKLIDVSSISTATVTVGAGGVGSTSSNVTGTDGGDSIWSDGTNTVTGSGGGAAAGSTANYDVGLGGSATGGDLNVSGGMGGSSLGSDAGGDSFLGIMPHTQYPTSRAAGLDGILGSGGAPVYNSYPAAVHGGHGGDGIVIVTEYK